jgi:hypothetical protein
VWRSCCKKYAGPGQKPKDITAECEFYCKNEEKLDPEAVAKYDQYLDDMIELRERRL